MCSSTDIFVFFFLACITNRCDYPSWIMFMFKLVTVDNLYFNFELLCFLSFYLFFDHLFSAYDFWTSELIRPVCQTPFSHRVDLNSHIVSVNFWCQLKVVKVWLSLKHLNSCWSVGDECCWAAKTMSKKMTPTHFVVAFFQRPNSAEIYMSFVENNMLNQHTDLIYRPQLDGV